MSQDRDDRQRGPDGHEADQEGQHRRHEGAERQQQDPHRERQQPQLAPLRIGRADIADVQIEGRAPGDPDLVAHRVDGKSGQRGGNHFADGHHQLRGAVAADSGQGQEDESGAPVPADEGGVLGGPEGRVPIRGQEGGIGTALVAGS